MSWRGGRGLAEEDGASGGATSETRGTTIVVEAVLDEAEHGLGGKAGAGVGLAGVESETPMAGAGAGAEEEETGAKLEADGATADGVRLKQQP